MKSYDDYQHDSSYGFIWDKVNARFMAYILKNEYERNGMWPKEGWIFQMRLLVNS